MKYTLEQLINHAKSSVDNANDNISKLTPEILSMDGMSGNKTRHLYNNICSLNNANYLEIGTWKGSSFISAFYNNEINPIVIDNWAEFNGPKDEFISNVNRLCPNIESVLLLEKERGLYNRDTYDTFVINAKDITFNLKETIDSYRDKGYSIIGYGAAAKGMTLLNFGNISMDYIIDDNELKHDLLTPGTNIIIKGIDILKDIDSDKVLFVPLAWNFYDEIYKKIKNIRNNDTDLFVKYFPKIDILK
jgi:hypothetical protein